MLDRSPSPGPYDDLEPGYGLDARNVTKWFISAALLQYATTGIAMPFEVAKVLMQVQWIPKDSIEGETIFQIPEEEEEDAEKDDSVSFTSILRGFALPDILIHGADERRVGGVLFS